MEKEITVSILGTGHRGADAYGKQHQTQCEIDFVVNDGMNKYYIQSALNIDDKNKEKTELRPLLSARDFFKKVVITKTRMKRGLTITGFTISDFTIFC